jgi:hypothetical protein
MQTRKSLSYSITSSVRAPLGTTCRLHAAAPPKTPKNSRRFVFVPKLKRLDCNGSNKCFSRHQNHCRSARQMSLLSQKLKSSGIKARSALVPIKHLGPANVPAPILFGLFASIDYLERWSPPRSRS